MRRSSRPSCATSSTSAHELRQPPADAKLLPLAGGHAIGLADAYAQHAGRITFLPNRFETSWRGRLAERAFVVSPRLGIAYRAVRSLFEAGDRVF